MKIMFINGNGKATFVNGQTVYESQNTENTASKIIAAWSAGNKEFSSKEQRDAADALEALFASDRKIGRLNELEQCGSPMIKVYNRNPHVPKKINLNR